MPNRKKDDLFEFEIHTMTRKEMQEAMHRRLRKIYNEFLNAFEFIKKYPKSATFFGSARASENDFYYQKARHLSERISKELGYTIFSGGGGGIMEAGNRGAFEAGGKTVGLNIRLPHQQQRNKYTLKTIEISYFFVRKVALSFAAEAYIFFPGGYGTLDEFFEIVTLIQTGKIPKVPLILFGNEYWGKLNSFLKDTVYSSYKAIDEKDLELFTITEDEDLILKKIATSPERTPLPSSEDANLPLAIKQ
ncbi:MAG: Rossman fold protein, TIGR00730 family [Candidatus Taylorbacteria bacterium RIFCSPLOWO2_02_FULL_43_11]|uniref:Cytokinin riboside 5'-monophosphate phosphoribohydrolase n=1 Tax=Candidatus Taylorbacteria bacterium RIFCSPHIGHO2_02_FULL_43_32b TaxID=1802306 RepID=A0A1G2MHK1_9BACT|nr:MAG: Rossman fold protein, TIGR00730 family [Candidatus Taylorbacteria bacterium RIFCSPHIGHO2_01_FULL_43_47]OHA22511.1 MAG: Rossman fold protein, TIGR00730 family [Candidatus Taylorbacteria bacterium RIFCSPHIGHO2_02_FULL_43_32b]OHA29417.1 MAG: Rossman fold protein, TIGR00730 family [Candidatus Taylorbacteria bacterium RIFCSPLOWO2_01_FULL_43_44]OHA35900.1 MAG: Rossman fold protein, TIGR00730 family [Candidatus Taylorbacteria bacterium RIFCSPLOWO2_02_FULL_43_11]